MANKLLLRRQLVTGCLTGMLALLPAGNLRSANLTTAELEQIKAIKAALPPPQPPPDPKTVSFKLFPDGENRELAIRTCAVCHLPELVVANRHTIEEWDNIIAKMVAYGARANEDEQLAILIYLATYLVKPDPTPVPDKH